MQLIIIFITMHIICITEGYLTQYNANIRYVDITHTYIIFLIIQYAGAKIVLI